MVFLGRTYNPAEIPEDNTFTPIPAGWYTARIVSADLTTTKRGDGEYIKLRLDVTGPSHAGRVVFSNINIKNASPKAEEIGVKQLASIGRAINSGPISDTTQLIGGVVEIKVTISKSDEYDDRNEVKAYRKPGGASPMPAQPQTHDGQGPEQMSLQQPASKPPWASK